jgi:hypothetical protein
MRKNQDILLSGETQAVIQQHLARLSSMQHRVAIAWLNIVPTRDTWEIDDEAV